MKSGFRITTRFFSNIFHRIRSLSLIKYIRIYTNQSNCINVTVFIYRECNDIARFQIRSQYILCLCFIFDIICVLR